MFRGRATIINMQLAALQFWGNSPNVVWSVGKLPVVGNPGRGL